MKKIFLISFIILLSSACAKASSDPRYNTPLQVGDKKIMVQVVTTPADMQEGLSGRTSLTDDEGMLFNFGTSTMPEFWMKDMNFDLDFVWISQNKIIGITSDVPAPILNQKSTISNLTLYPPPSSVDEVLEVNAGWSSTYKIKVGDGVK